MHYFSSLAAVGRCVHPVIVIGALALTPLISRAADDPSKPEEQQVVITGSKDPVLMSYRDMLAGLDAFDEYHALAPSAPEVRFRLRPHKTQTATLDGLTLSIVGDSVTIPVTMNKDAEFSVPRSTVADDENADMALSKNKNDYSLEIEVNTPEVPPNTRRLGDLRMECEVGIAIAKNEIGLFLKLTINTMLLTSDWCMSGKMVVPSYIKQTIDGATLIDGTQRIVLKVDDDHRSFEAPINDKAYSDNDLIELQYSTKVAK